MEKYNKLYLTSDENTLMDPNYRYIICTIEYKKVNKKGTIITVLENFSKFCKELQFNELLLIKIIGKFLSCKTGIDKNTNLYYLQGDFISKQINDIIYNFIKKYLLCITCDKPEIILKCKNEKIKQKCKACGNKCYLDVIDENIINIFTKNKELL
jgi:translation initiation factor 5